MMILNRKNIFENIPFVYLQGMDAENERQMFTMLVEHMTDVNASQYFLVTPKVGGCCLSTVILRALSSLRGLRVAPEAPPLCRETQSLGQQMLNAPVGINGLTRVIARKMMIVIIFFPHDN